MKPQATYWVDGVRRAQRIQDERDVVALRLAKFCAALLAVLTVIAIFQQ